jgi:hypothetical protein
MKDSALILTVYEDVNQGVAAEQFEMKQPLYIGEFFILRIAKIVNCETV